MGPLVIVPAVVAVVGGGLLWLHERAVKKSKIKPQPTNIIPNPHVDPNPAKVIPGGGTVPVNPAIPSSPFVPIVLPSVVTEPPFDPGGIPEPIAHNQPITAGAKNANGVLVLSSDDPKGKEALGKTEDDTNDVLISGQRSPFGADSSASVQQGQKGLVSFYQQKVVLDPTTKQRMTFTAADVDGAVGPKTRKATWAFQRWVNFYRKTGLSEDGYFGPNTNAALALFDAPIALGTTAGGNVITSIVPTHSDLPSSGVAVPQAHALFDYLKAKGIDQSPGFGQLVLAFQQANNADPNATRQTGIISTTGHYDAQTSAALTIYTGDPIPPDPTALQSQAQVTDPSVAGPAALAASNLYAYLKKNGNDKQFAEVALVKAFQHAANTDPKYAGPANPNPAARVLKTALSEDGSYGPATAAALAVVTLDAIKS